ncbi:MAG TPA: methyltransferase domain-containing protein [Vicinamibacterales bacterium]|nr:methyltransferase domain-containing protein [Vicinamibacterales bacterium]
MGLLDRLAPRKGNLDVRPQGPTSGSADDPVFATKALRKFLQTLTSRELPVLLDLGPLVGSNVTYFGEQLGCKIFVEDIFADLDRHVREDKLDQLPEFFKKRFSQRDNSVDGILCWDVLDYLDRASGQELASQLTRVLRPDGALLGFFGSAPQQEPLYTKFIIVDEQNLRHRTYPAARKRQSGLQNRDIMRLFADLRVADSFLLKTNSREILFKKPA